MIKTLSDNNLKHALYVHSPHNLGTQRDDTFRYYVDLIVESHTMQELMQELSELRQKGR